MRGKRRFVWRLRGWTSDAIILLAAPFYGVAWLLGRLAAWVGGKARP